MDFNQLMAKLGRAGQAFVAGGLLIFIFSFLPWYSVSYSFKGDAQLGIPGSSASADATAWDAGFGAWFPVLLLTALGVVAALWAFDVIKWPALMLAAIGTGTAILAAVIIILRWVTFPSESTSGIGGSGSAGAGWALYVSLVVALAMAVLGYMGFTAAGGDIKNLGAAFQSQQGPVGPPPGQQG